ncbi:MAG: response regulator [Acidobacteria bacterium]|nr:response regulator [Acidobacteriota bacterium]
MSKPRVLVIEDEADIRELIRYNLEQEGFKVREAPTGEEGIVDARKKLPDVILLDLMLPGIQGLEVCRRLRSMNETRNTPLIMVTAKDDEADIVAGLEMGADDYLAKPFSTRELVARLRSVLRRGPASEAEPRDAVASVGPLEIDARRHEASIDGSALKLTLAEFKLLQALTDNPGRVFTRAQLIRNITGGDTHIVERNIDVHVRSLRKKLADHGHLIKTVRGVGYKIEEQGAETTG